MRIWRTVESGKELTSPASYIQRVAVTTTIDAIRRAKARREEQLIVEAEDGDPMGNRLSTIASPPGESPERRAEQREIGERIERALSRLGDDRRRAVGLYLQGFRLEEVSHLLGWSEPRTRNLTYRGLEEIRRLLRAEGIEYETQ